MPRTAQRLHATAQGAVVAALRETLLLPLDDLLAVTREFIHRGLALGPGPRSAPPRRV